jgi:hypothetical protein
MARDDAALLAATIRAFEQKGISPIKKLDLSPFLIGPAELA